ncbi:hypothetical protein C8Q79DRAFT_1010552 [Trametes meyenii]|nr:hypothetical protein C8Q79DRAFT_1010552 [Trametes meyenii]
MSPGHHSPHGSDDYEPSMSMRNEYTAQCKIETPESVFATEPSKVRLRDSSKSRARIAKQYAIGGALDSQTTDSQYVRGLVEHPSQSGNAYAPGDVQGGLLPVNGKARNEPSTDQQRPSKDLGAQERFDPGVAPTAPDLEPAGQADTTANRLKEQLEQSEREVAALKQQLAYYQRLCDVHTERVRELEWDVLVHFHDARSEEGWLDPDEQSQVLMYPSSSSIGKKRKLGHPDRT